MSWPRSVRRVCLQPVGDQFLQCACGLWRATRAQKSAQRRFCFGTTRDRIARQAAPTAPAAPVLGGGRSHNDCALQPVVLWQRDKPPRSCSLRHEAPVSFSIQLLPARPEANSDEEESQQGLCLAAVAPRNRTRSRGGSTSGHLRRGRECAVFQTLAVMRFV